MREISTNRFGLLEVEENKIIHFPKGIPAFEEEHEFVLVPYEEESPYFFLQSAQRAELAFLVTDPFVFFPDYTAEIDDTTVDELKIQNNENVEIYAILTIPNGSVRYMTANLLAPIVINTENMQAKQVVMDKSNYKTKHRLFPEGGQK